MAKVRLQGTREEVDRLAAVLARVHGLQVVERSPAYRNRGNSGLVRVYLEVRLR
jgi:hypothetical protein